MHTALVSTNDISAQGSARLGDAASHHLRTVLRVHVGDEVRLLDGCGHRRLATIVDTGKAGVVCEMRGEVETLPQPPVDITLFQCVAKPVRFDWLLEKAVELGVARIVPIVSARSVVRIAAGEKQDRWQRIVEAALCQCGGGWITEIEAPLKWNEALARMMAFDGPLLVGALFGTTRPVGEVLQELRTTEIPRSVGWLIGPEGDFSPDELDSAVQAARAIPVSLGTNVLRVETAALFGVSATLAILG